MNFYDLKLIFWRMDSFKPVKSVTFACAICLDDSNCRCIMQIDENGFQLVDGSLGNRFIEVANPEPVFNRGFKLVFDGKSEHDFDCTEHDLVFAFKDPECKSEDDFDMYEDNSNCISEDRVNNQFSKCTEGGGDNERVCMFVCGPCEHCYYAVCYCRCCPLCGLLVDTCNCIYE